MGEIQVKLEFLIGQSSMENWLAKICLGQARCNVGRVTCFTRCFVQAMIHYQFVMVALWLLLSMVLEVTSSILT